MTESRTLKVQGAELHHRRTACRLCGATLNDPFLSLGPMPLANAFLSAPEEFAGELKFPLDVSLCKSCGLVQLIDVIDPGHLFADYIYVTGTSDTIAAHNRAYADDVCRLLGLTDADQVIEIASNDGSLLKCFRDLGVRTLGVEPATNIAEFARAAGITTLNRFFDAAAAPDIAEQHGRAKAVIANNVLAHVDDPVGFLAGCKNLLNDDGMVLFEVPYLGPMLERREFDTIYHEHLSYFSLSALNAICAAAGLRLVRADHLSIHGGSVRGYAMADRSSADQAAELRADLEREIALGYRRPARFEQFALEVDGVRQQLRALLERMQNEGRPVAAYGAPAKGNTLLNYCHIGTGLVAFTVDKNALKVGKFTPGMHIRVLPVETLAERRPDAVLILAWNFADEIMRQQDDYKRGGGRFILPLPEPMVV